MRPLVSIVCVTYKRREMVLRCLESCVAQDYPNLEILVVVNASSDGTEEAIQQSFPQVRMIRTHRNMGFFPALNLAIANAGGEYVMTVDDDAYFLETDAVMKLVEAFKKEPELAAATCNLAGPSEATLKDNDRYIPVFTTGFTMLPRKVFTEWVGYYPDMFFRSGGETYICAALWDQGKRVKRVCDVQMYHERSMQGRSDWDWKFYGLRSQILVTIMREPWYLIPASLTSKACKSLIQYICWGHFLTWVQAWLSTLLYLPAALRLRRPIRWRTRRLLWHLRGDTVSRLHNLEGSCIRRP